MWYNPGVDKNPLLENWLTTHYYRGLVPAIPVMLPDAKKISGSGLESKIFQSLLSFVLTKAALGKLIPIDSSYYHGRKITQQQPHILIASSVGHTYLGFDQSGKEPKPYVVEKFRYQKNMAVASLPIPGALLGVPELNERLAANDLVGSQKFIAELWDQKPELKVGLVQHLSGKAGLALQDYIFQGPRFVAGRDYLKEMQRLV
jgi:hypothetical protein